MCMMCIRTIQLIHFSTPNIFLQIGTAVMFRYLYVQSCFSDVTCTIQYSILHLHYHVQCIICIYMQFILSSSILTCEGCLAICTFIQSILSGVRTIQCSILHLQLYEQCIFCIYMQFIISQGFHSCEGGVKRKSAWYSLHNVYAFNVWYILIFFDIFYFNALSVTFSLFDRMNPDTFSYFQSYQVKLSHTQGIRYILIQRCANCVHFTQLYQSLL